MVECPLCDRRVDELHPVPTEVITRDLYDTISSTDSGLDLLICAECLHLLMEGHAPSDLFIASTDSPEIDPA